MLNLKILNLKRFFFVRKAFDANIANFVYLRKNKNKSNDSNLPEWAVGRGRYLQVVFVTTGISVYVYVFHQ